MSQASKIHRRRHVRMKTHTRAIVYREMVCLPTVIRDISNSGVCLSGAAGLFPGQALTIALLNGEKRDGVVRWWLNDCCGIQFKQCLAIDDTFYLTALKKAVKSEGVSG